MDFDEVFRHVIPRRTDDEMNEMATRILKDIQLRRLGVISCHRCKRHVVVDDIKHRYICDDCWAAFAVSLLGEDS